MDDRTLRARVVQAQLGDTQALDAVLRDIQLPILRHARTIVGDDDRAWDVVQVTLLAIARKLGALRDPRLFRPWAFRIATRVAVKSLSRDRREELSAEPPEIPVEQHEVDPRIEEIERLVESLPPASRVVIQMHFLDGLKLWEIAESLEIAEGTVKSRLNYGLNAIRRNIRS